jgi:hypothetical protein
VTLRLAHETGDSRETSSAFARPQPQFIMALYRAVDSDDHYDTMDDLVFMSKPRLGKHASSSNIVLPSHLQFKSQAESQSSLQMNASQSYEKGDTTLATLTESFSTMSEDNPLEALSLSQDVSFEVYEALPRRVETRRGKPALSLPSSDLAEPQQMRGRWPIISYKPKKHSPPVQGPLTPVESLITTTSSDSWDELNGTPREVSLLDFAESRDDEEEEYKSGHDGDGERDGRVEIYQMQRMSGEFHQSNDSSPGGSSFRGSLPKFAQGPLSHLRDGPKHSPDMPRTFKTSSNSNFISPRSYVSQEDFLHSAKRAEKENSFDKISVKERKGLFQSMWNKIFCVP